MNHVRFQFKNNIFHPFFIAWPGQVDCVMDMFAADGKLKRKQFEPAMAELDRRVCLEHGLYWDYQSISQYSDRKESR